MPNPTLYNTIEYRPDAPGTAGVEKAMASWGSKGLQRARADFFSQELDVFKVDECAAYVDGANVFDWVDDGGSLIGSTVVVRQRRMSPDGGLTFSGGKTIFFGVLVSTPREARGQSEGASYVFNGPWWYLLNKTYKMQYTVWNGYVTPGQPNSGNTYVTKYGAHLWLNRSLTNQWLCTGEQIQAAVQYAIDQGAPIQLLGNADTTVNAGTDFERVVSVSAGIKTFSDVPVDEVVDITCAEIIKKQIRWTPDCVVWFDYTTTPYPTFYCQRRQYLGA